MGLTHYWRRKVQLDASAFKAAAGDLQTLFGKISPPLGGPKGTGHPIITADRIAFNGIKPATCEPFDVAVVEHDRHGRPEPFGFTKTEFMPYDICVRAALIVLQHHLGEKFKVGSDDKAGWDEAKELVTANLGYGSDFALLAE